MASAVEALVAVVRQEDGSKSSSKQPNPYNFILFKSLSMKNSFSFLLLFALLLSCNDDELDCSAVLCVGPPVLLIEILEDGENVIENDTYSIEDISISGTDQETFILEIRTWTSLEEITGLFVNNQEWLPQVYELTLNLGTDFSIPMTIDIERSASGGCCGGIPRIDEITVNGESQDIGNGGSSFTINLD